MAKKTRKAENITSGLFREPIVAYRKKKAVTANEWNPNVPLHGTREEWWEHFHQIEKETFTPLEIANQEFEEWRRKFLANRLLLANHLK
jgi:hypothetical protein